MHSDCQAFYAFAGGGVKQQAVAVAIAKALILGGSQRQSVLKACAVAIANYGCSKIQPTLASLPQLSCCPFQTLALLCIGAQCCICLYTAASLMISSWSLGALAISGPSDAQSFVIEMI